MAKDVVARERPKFTFPKMNIRYFIEERRIPLSEIYVPKEDKTKANNITRRELNRDNVSALRISLRRPLWSEPMMIVKRIPGGKTINGITYYYELVLGFHRFEALSENETREWWMDVYDFTGDPEAEIDIQALENDHLPRQPLDKMGIANWLAYCVGKSYIENTKEAILKKAQSTLKNTNTRTLKAAAQLAAKMCGAHTDIVTRTIGEIKEYLSANPPQDDSEYYHSGQLDPVRKEFGWTVLEGYEHEFIHNAIKNYHLKRKPGFDEYGERHDGYTSYFNCHVKVPKEGKTLTDSRKSMIESFKRIEDALEAACEYKQANKVWPWRVEGFFPQDNTKENAERDWISPSEI